MRKSAFCNFMGKQRRRSDLISAFVFATQIVRSLYFCCCTARFVSDLVGNPKDRFSRGMAHISDRLLQLSLKQYIEVCEPVTVKVL